MVDILCFHHPTPKVSKGKTAAWLATELGIDYLNTIAIGNDYNDVGLLEWAAHSSVVENAPDDMRAEFETLSSNDSGGVAEAVGRWLAYKASDTFIWFDV